MTSGTESPARLHYLRNNDDLKDRVTCKVYVTSGIMMTSGTESPARIRYLRINDDLRDRVTCEVTLL